MLMLIFHAANDAYCCSCESIIEIVPKVPLKAIPQSPPYIIGILNYAGNFIPVIDFSKFISSDFSKNHMHTRIILLKNPKTDSNIPYIGLLAESVIETKEINEESFNDSGLKIKRLQFMDGIYSDGKRNIQKILIDQFFQFFDVNN